MTMTTVAPREQLAEVEPRRPLAAVPVMAGNVPGGNSGSDVPLAVGAPTRDAGPRARAREAGEWLVRAAARVWAFVKANFTPPDVVTKKQPNLREVFNHARWGSSIRRTPPRIR